MGENPSMVFNVGGLGVDNIKNTNLLSKKEIESELDFKFYKKNILVTFHPISLEKDSALQMGELIIALSKLDHTLIIFTMPNADPGGSEVYDLITNFVSNNENAISYNSLGVLRYLSLIKYVDGVVGNSSSGLLEVPSLRKGTINIGDRQKNREKASSIINCAPDSKSISNALSKLYSKDFQSKLKNVINPYGNGGASLKILKILESVDISNIIFKIFYDKDI